MSEDVLKNMTLSIKDVYLKTARVDVLCVFMNRMFEALYESGYSKTIAEIKVVEKIPMSDDSGSIIVFEVSYPE